MGFNEGLDASNKRRKKEQDAYVQRTELAKAKGERLAPEDRTEKDWLDAYYEDYTKEVTAAGGLNQKACFTDIKNEVNIKSPTNLYESLPVMGTYKRNKKGTTAETEKGFIIDDVSENRNKYEYIQTDNEGNDSLRIDILVAQLSVAVKDMNLRLATLEKV